jgi:hypothetical protein
LVCLSASLLTQTNIHYPIGVDNCGKTFFISFAFLSDESEESYEWGLNQLKEVFSSLGVPSIITGPGAIATDCDQALRNALSTVFPESPALLCVWHANKNIQQHCKPMFTTTEAYENFLSSWIRIVYSTTEEEYHTRLQQFIEELKHILLLWNMFKAHGLETVESKQLYMHGQTIIHTLGSQQPLGKYIYH